MKAKEQLVDDFKNRLDQLGYISDMTGGIFHDPIYIKGSSSPVEREFIEESVRNSNKNPFNRERLTLAEVKAIPTDNNFKQKIEDEIKNFLEANKDHPDIKSIEEAIDRERYQPSTPAIESEARPGQPSEPTEDDLLAIQQATGIGAQAYRAPAGFFRQPAANIQWTIINPGQDFWLQSYDPEPNGLNRHRIYYSANANFISNIVLMGRDDNTFFIQLITRQIFGDGLRQFIEALQAQNFFENSPNVYQYPGQGAIEQPFIFHGTLDEILQALPRIFEVINSLEGPGALGNTQNEILDSFRDVAPRPRQP